MTTTHCFDPDYAIPPGETLKDVMEMKGISQADLAVRTGLAEKTISQLVRGECSLTHDTAAKLELAVGVPASFWNAREAAYRDSLIRSEETRTLAVGVEWLKSIPVRHLASRGYIALTKDQPMLVRQALKFFGVSSVDAWRTLWGSPSVQFRGGHVQRKHPGAVAAWLRMGELKAETVKCKPYDAQRFRDALKAIRRYADKEASEWYPAMVRLCAEAGVAVVFVRQIPGASISGATKWINKDKAAIMLSLKYKTDDHVWFTFFHEAVHVLKHGKKLVFIEEDGAGDDELEREADRIARDILIPPSESRKLPTLKGRIEIRSFARSIGVSPGIVVGRLQRDGFMSHKHCHDLKVMLEWPHPEETIET